MLYEFNCLTYIWRKSIMYFHDIEIKGFRGINSLKIDDFQSVNLFIGKNNACKTSILEAFFILLGANNPELILRINNFRDLLMNEENDLRFIFHNLDFNNELKITGGFGKTYYRELIIDPQIKEPSLTNQTTVNSLVDKQRKLMKFDTTYVNNTASQLIYRLKIKEYLKSIKNYQSSLTIKQGQIAIDIDKKYSEKEKGVFVSPKVLITGNLEKELEELIVSKRTQEIIEVLSIIDKNIIGISMGSNGMIFFDVAGIERLVPINLAGDGIRRMLSLILAIYNAQNGVILIDEIENGLHYSILERLWLILINSAKKFNVQLFITTHNLETLKYLNVAASKLDSEAQNSLRSYTIRKSEGDNLIAYKYAFDKFSFSLEQGIEIR